MMRTVTTHTLFFLLAICFLSGCGKMKEMMDRTENIQKSLMSHCDCDDVRIMGYQMENLVTTAHYVVVGSNFKSPVEEGERLKGFLEKEVQDFCDIDQFTIEFINKGKSQFAYIRKCEVAGE